MTSLVRDIRLPASIVKEPTKVCDMPVKRIAYIPYDFIPIQFIKYLNVGKNTFHRVYHYAIEGRNVKASTYPIVNILSITGL